MKKSGNAKPVKTVTNGFSYVWETFLPIAFPHDLPPDADDAWLVSKGIETIAPAMLRHVRFDVLPFIRTLDRMGCHSNVNRLEWYAFLLHDRASGVPTTEEDKRLYIHLRLRFKRPIKLTGRPGWYFTRPVVLSAEIAGIDRSTLVDGNIDKAWQLIGDQAVLFMKIIEAHRPDVCNLVLLKQMRQFLHYFANMSQVRVF